MDRTKFPGYFWHCISRKHSNRYALEYLFRHYLKLIVVYSKRTITHTLYITIVTTKVHHKYKHGRKIAPRIGSYSSIFQDLWRNDSIFKAWNFHYEIPVFSRMRTNHVRHKRTRHSRSRAGLETIISSFLMRCVMCFTAAGHRSSAWWAEQEAYWSHDTVAFVSSWSAEKLHVIFSE